jgi:hypothetical protein
MCPQERGKNEGVQKIDLVTDVSYIRQEAIAEGLRDTRVTIKQQNDSAALLMTCSVCERLLGCPAATVIPSGMGNARTRAGLRQASRLSKRQARSAHMARAYNWRKVLCSAPSAERNARWAQLQPEL